MFQNFSILSRFRYANEGFGKVLHQPSSPFTITDLERFTGRRMTLDMASLDGRYKHKHIKLAMKGHLSGVLSNADGSIVIESISTNELQLNFVSVQKIKKMKEIRLEEYKVRNNERMRLKIETDNGIHKDISNIIRHKEPGWSHELFILSVGFPIIMKANQRIITITFDRPLTYYAEELRLSNGTEFLGPYFEKKEKFPLLRIDFDLGFFSNQNYQTLTLSNETFDKKISLGNIENIKRMYYNENLIWTLQPESYPVDKPQYSQTKSKKFGSTRHLDGCGSFTRFRYESEIKNGTISNLSSIRIRNLKQYVGLKVSLDLLNWKSDTLHSSLQLHLLKELGGFVVKDGKFEGTILEDEMKLEIICIKKLKKSGNGENHDSINCRIRATMGSETEISNVIRHKGPNVSKEFQNPSVSFPPQETGIGKLMQLTFSKNLAYYNEELELHHGDDIIQAENPKQKNTFLNHVVFDLSKFTKTITSPFKLYCPIFKRVLDVPVLKHLEKIYPEVVSERIESSTSQLSLKPSTSKSNIDSSSEYNKPSEEDILKCIDERKKLKRGNPDNLFPINIGMKKHIQQVSYDAMATMPLERPHPERNLEISHTITPESDHEDLPDEDSMMVHNQLEGFLPEIKEDIGQPFSPESCSDNINKRDPMISQFSQEGQEGLSKQSICNSFSPISGDSLMSHDQFEDFWPLVKGDSICKSYSPESNLMEYKEEDLLMQYDVLSGGDEDTSITKKDAISITFSPESHFNDQPTRGQDESGSDEETNECSFLIPDLYSMLMNAEKEVVNEILRTREAPFL